MGFSLFVYGVIIFEEFELRRVFERRVVVGAEHGIEVGEVFEYPTKFLMYEAHFFGDSPHEFLVVGHRVQRLEG